MTSTETTGSTIGSLDAERAELIEQLGTSRHFLRFTVRDLPDDVAARRSTVSALCPGGVIKHVTFVEAGWADFIVDGTGSMAETGGTEHADSFRMLPGETLDGLLRRYAEVAERTDELVRTLPDLDASQALPEAPWFPPGARWSARRVLLHIVAETAQHAGHGDILRESIDGARTMAGG